MASKIRCCVVPRRSLKCAREGCHNAKIEDSEFCVACLSSGKSKPAARVTCDHLTAIRGSR
jgi:hypothetical protein